MYRLVTCLYTLFHEQEFSANFAKAFATIFYQKVNEIRLRQYYCLQFRSLPATSQLQGFFCILNLMSFNYAVVYQ